MGKQSGRVWADPATYSLNSISPRHTRTNGCLLAGDTESACRPAAQLRRGPTSRQMIVMRRRNSDASSCISRSAHLGSTRISKHGPVAAMP